MLDVVMKMRRLRDSVLLQEDLNFLLTNRVPRILLTRFMGWFSKRRHPLVRAASMAVWRACTELDLSDAKKSRFDSVHDCFTRELRPGARTIDADPGVLVSPCDAIVGACGSLSGVQLFQAKGYPYSAVELFGDAAAAERFRGGTYATLRLTSSMYHRFHAPHDARIDAVTYLSGDTWNVNPIALARIERLFCRNERAVVHLQTAAGHPVALVAVAAILVASIRLHCLDVLLHLRYRGPKQLVCDATVAKGEELGWFEHGSTIVVFAPPGCALAAGISPGMRVAMGQALMRLPAGAAATTETDAAAGAVPSVTTRPSGTVLP